MAIASSHGDSYHLDWTRHSRDHVHLVGLPSLRTRLPDRLGRTALFAKTILTLGITIRAASDPDARDKSFSPRLTERFRVWSNAFVASFERHYRGGTIRVRIVLTAMAEVVATALYPALTRSLRVPVLAGVTSK